MISSTDIEREILEYNPFGSGRAEKYPLPISKIACQINKYQSDRAGYPKYKISTVKSADIGRLKDFLNEHHYPFLELNLDAQKLLLKKVENKIEEFFRKSSRSENVFLFGLESLAEGRAAKAKTTFLKMIIYQASKYFDRADNIFLISTKDFMSNIKGDGDGWLEGRIRVFECY